MVKYPRIARSYWTWDRILWEKVDLMNVVIANRREYNIY